MNTNEELKTRPDFKKLAIEYYDRWGRNADKDIDTFEILSYKTAYRDCWTTHVEPLQAKLDKSESENQKLIDLLKDAHETLIIASLIDKSNTCRDSAARIDAFLKTKTNP